MQTYGGIKWLILSSFWDAMKLREKIVSPNVSDQKRKIHTCSIFDERSGNRPAGNSFTRSKSPWWIFSIVLNSCILVVSVKLIYWWAASVASWWTFVMQLMRGRPMAILLNTIFCLTSEKKTQCHVEANVHTDVRDCFFSF